MYPSEVDRMFQGLCEEHLFFKPHLLISLADGYYEPLAQVAYRLNRKGRIKIENIWAVYIINKILNFT